MDHADIACQTARAEVATGPGDAGYYIKDELSSAFTMLPTEIGPSKRYLSFTLFLFID